VKKQIAKQFPVLSCLSRTDLDEIRFDGPTLNVHFSAANELLRT
jgi:hypothetical protein